MKEIKRILIANRGEIALRALRTIQEMGKEAIVVHSTADKDALYVKYADASICIGKPRSSESYLNIPAIITACEISEADAIFPGYGFLSENQNFVEICAKHGIKFIGPSVAAMALMSDKSKAKQVMMRAGIPVVPGSDGAIKDIEAAKKLAREIGYPVIVKAAAGGGGRGMRVVEREEDLEKNFWSAESEAMSAFGDGTMYMEKYITNPRHIEVQVLGDEHGNVVHIGERDCSLQRRHQKLIEESPAVILDEKTRAELHATAVKATKAIGYAGAGTFEFLYDQKDNKFYFIEMNTRLQVEHCVSEMCSGLDLIEWMIRIAQGEKLLSQDEIKLSGHAIECRITAEDPKSFTPNPGKITKYIAPGGRNVRMDSHVYEGYSVPPYYDSMIGKLIVYDKDRTKAIAKMKVALDELVIQGIKTTKDFHLHMMDNSDFINNLYDTNYLSKH
ncbi:acetyl-CoA carboxylase biotin carboxylase subunit [Campylobacter hyointestinalis subsp. hyointestinalis]|uniref:Biotin carboxylase n=1 Tax=Campylobacter hyointestinalis subsp. hyointestinalis TaxID=91352 RepID=A0A9W5EYD0_CAMHY|nr:acetyl-CoA carboxylase biotin carboxylase subunit [Campylobacter hyointestinalis]PPB53324.1 acetyl-CoA carboxylase biotin carboxylase subunit [Campylobacter hyointestinalis subsp. hyointestinalis]PPB55163.1 acetyl-CoA carboxylase biotin carboxylase subunit [Campylobacter hyointestinalis subsp. hyointestinalis]PPB58210.1 acetyl-CoA carboxylase biotin carboxylase subunit [Campylobacter hyointestinalis subsp. hyointestinalis]PPB59891.1 acetyl-CoA carboxylase biotin carboxylase subunit [Campylob